MVAGRRHGVFGDLVFWFEGEKQLDPVTHTRCTSWSGGQDGKIMWACELEVQRGQLSVTLSQNKKWQGLGWSSVQRSLAHSPVPQKEIKGKKRDPPWQQKGLRASVFLLVRWFSGSLYLTFQTVQTLDTSKASHPRNLSLPHPSWILQSFKMKTNEIIQHTTYLFKDDSYIRMISIS